jgi:glycerol-3-phosphate dehydrogenase
VTSRKAGDLALAASTQDGRMLTLTPWRGRALVGTSQSETFIDPHDEDLREAEIASFIADANDAFPALALTPDAVTLVHRGIVPAQRGRGGRPMLKRHAEIIDHARDGVAGAITVIGVKYTTARAVAEKAVDRAAKKLRKPVGKSRTARTILPGASIADHEALAIETEHRARVTLPDASRAHITGMYGSRCVEIIEIAASEPVLLEPLGAGTPAIGAEVVHAIRREAACHLDDVLMRRCGIGAAAWPDGDVVTRAAELAARELRWSEAQRDEEISALRARYSVTGR